MTTDVMTVQANDLGPLVATRLSMSPLELDGYLTGVIVTPQPALISPSAWLMRLWGADPPIFDEEVQIKTVLSELIKRYNALSTKIDRSVTRLELDNTVNYRPAFLAGDEKPTHNSVRTWVRGFWTAMTLAPETWSSLLEDERTQILIRPFVGFFDLEPDEPDELGANVDALLDEDAALIPRLILVLRKLAQIRQADAPASRPAHRSKVGRNEPCPCGSGRKYKRCCATLDLSSRISRGIQTTDVPSTGASFENDQSSINFAWKRARV
jgi:uncharacterized protein